MERRVAQGQFEALAGLQQALENVPRLGLLAQFDGRAQLVRLDDGAGRGQGGTVDIGAGEVPAVLAMSD
ncbi:hypothetical protein D3C71_1756650 [compost metagenome]